MSARSEIENTVYRYAIGFDNDDFDELAACFTDDIEFVIAGTTVAGKGPVLEFFRGRRKLHDDAGRQVRHVTTNVLIDEESAIEARCRAYITLVATHADGSITVERTGWYRDHLVIDGGVWRFKRRELTFDQPY